MTIHNNSPSSPSLCVSVLSDWVPVRLFVPFIHSPLIRFLICIRLGQLLLIVVVTVVRHDDDGGVRLIPLVSIIVIIIIIIMGFYYSIPLVSSSSSPCPSSTRLLYRVAIAVAVAARR